MRNVKDGFVFETDFGITYKIGFTDDSGYTARSSFVNAVFSFAITPIDGQVKQKDPRVEQTIIKALLLTFDASPDAVISYVCSVDNDQEVARNRLFHGWYMKMGQNNFVKLDYTDADSRIHTSVVFQRNHPAEEEIRSRFTLIFDK